jgi:uncharacterized protein
VGEEGVNLGLNLECGASAPLSKAAASRRTPQLRIGVIADTHGLLRPEALHTLQGVDAILHAGDIGRPAIIEDLRAIAPINFVRGNNDGSDGTEIVRLTIGGLRILLTHILPRPRAPRSEVRQSLESEPADLVVFGHSHLPHNEVIDDIRYFNPASAGPRRFDYPVAVGMIDAGRAYHIALDERSIAALEKRMNQLSSV